MRLFNTYEINFIKATRKKEIILLGDSNFLRNKIIEESAWVSMFWPNVKYIADNDVTKQGAVFSAFGRNIPVRSFKMLKSEKNVVLLFSVVGKHTMEMLKQLEDMELDDSIECYSMDLIADNGFDMDVLLNNKYSWAKNTETQIEKKIHCCWFSGEKKPDKYQACIESWKKYCPDYEIVEWNSKNYDFTKNRYLQEAYESKVWAHASDYVRLDVVYRHGGIYMDMDVELMRNIDELLNFKAFFCYDKACRIDLGSAFGAVKNDALVGNLLSAYDNVTFLNPDGSQNRMHQPARLKNYFEKAGLRMDGRTEIVDERMFLSNKYLPSVDGSDNVRARIRQVPYGLHWHHAGWNTQEELKRREDTNKIRNELRKIFVWREA